MSARNGLRVRTQTSTDKPWVRVWTPKEGSLVAFEDMFEMLRGIMRCEVTKYCAKFGGDPSSKDAWERWGQMPRQLMWDSGDFAATYERLRAKHLLPDKTARATRPAIALDGPTDEEIERIAKKLGWVSHVVSQRDGEGFGHE